jgi:hypothetical protein
MGCTDASPTSSEVSATRWPPTGCTLTDIYAIADTGATTTTSIIGDVHQSPTRPHAGTSQPSTATAPLDTYSDDVIRHRHNRDGNRQTNKVIHPAAATQIRHSAQGHDHYPHKPAEDKNRGEAMRSLKRQLSDVIYPRLVAHARRRETAREGQHGNQTRRPRDRLASQHRRFVLLTTPTAHHPTPKTTTPIQFSRTPHSVPANLSCPQTRPHQNRLNTDRHLMVVCG